MSEEMRTCARRRLDGRCPAIQALVDTNIVACCYFGAVGAVIGASGIALLVVGNNGLDRFTDAFIRECPSGCDLSMHPDLAADQDSALLKSRMGMGMLVGGSATVIGAIVWGVTNRRTRRIGPHLEVAPSASGGTATATWTF